MKESDQIIKAKKDIKELDVQLKECAAQLGGVVYDSDIKIDGQSITDEISLLEEVIPRVKEQMDNLKSYTLSITEAEDNLKVCSSRIKELETNMGSIYEKVGVELYCFIGEKELAYPEINEVYKSIKEGELKSESLENKLYSQENSAGSKSILNIFSKSFKVRSIKKDIRSNNKSSLTKFKELGKLYSDIPGLINEESNESLLDVLEEYKKIKKDLASELKRKESLNLRINENKEKVKEKSNGQKLKSIYSKYEDEIVDTQKKISEKLVDLGLFIGDSKDIEFDNSDIKLKLKNFIEKQGELKNKKAELEYYEKEHKHAEQLKEINDRKEEIQIEENHISKLEETLNGHKAALEEIERESLELAKWLEDNLI